MTMASVREICIEALSRATLANRKQGAQGSLLEDAYKRLSGILQEYSDNNLITAYRGAVEFPGTAVELDINGVDIQAEGITRINACYYKERGGLEYFPMNFISYENFFDGSLSDYTYSTQPIGENKFRLYLKPRFVNQGRLVRIIYNKEIKLTLDDNVNLPPVYVELLTRALAYAMAVDKPRANPDKKNSLKQELDDLKTQVMANNADNRILTRQNTGGASYMQQLNAGSFIFGR